MKKCLLLVVLLLVGCAGAPESIPSPIPRTNTPTLPPTETAVPSTPTLEPSPTVVPDTVTPITPFGPEIVNFPGGGNLNIAGVLYRPEDAASQPWPAVLLLHMYGGGKQDWEDAAAQLAESGYVVLAIDMRGHGATGGGENWTEARKDHVQAIKFLSSVAGVDGDRVAVVGGSIGANMAMKLGETQEQLKTLVLLSPGLDYFGVKTQSALSIYGDRPIMIVASAGDTYSAESSETLASEAKGDVNLVIYEGLGHGTGMFDQEPGLMNDIIAWLDQFLK